MGNKSEVITAMTNVLRVSDELINSFSAHGYIWKAKREHLKMEIAKAREICVNNAVEQMFDNNLAALSRAEKLLSDYHFSGGAKESAEKQYRLYQRRLEHSLERFIDTFNS